MKFQRRSIVTRLHVVAISVAMTNGLLPLRASALDQAFSPPIHAPWGKVADNKIYAQKVVNDVMAENPELVALGLHAVPPGVDAKPGEPGEVSIAQVIDNIGEPDSPGDLEIAHQQAVKIFVGTFKGIPRMRVMAPLRDGSGRVIGLALFAFKDVEMAPISAHLKADRILEQLAARFPDQASLFKAMP